MTDIDRRTLLRLVSTAPVAAGFAWTDVEAQQAHAHAQAARTTAQRTQAPFKPKFFTAHEYATVGLLVDLIIPKDDRSGSATDAGVPEFMDFMMIDQPARQTAMRGGLAWIDRECVRRYDKPFTACAAAERTAVLDDIAWPTPRPEPTAVASSSVAEAKGEGRPQRARPEHSHGTAFFTSFRDLTASGFWTTRMGIDDLQYLGNVGVAEWKGCPEEVVKKLGLTPPSA
jgi:gluconate 2-dehydrogenase subunit 3-like protein